jgi:hypothetical protein
VNVSARHAERRVVMTHGLSVRSIKEAVHLSVGIMKQFNLADPELIRFVISCVLCDLLNRIRRQHKIVVKVHELWH